MKTKGITTALLFALFLTQAFSQNSNQTTRSSAVGKVSDHKFSVSTSYLTFANFGPEKTNTHHCELHLGYKLTPKDKIGIKLASWELFAPMGIQLWDPLFLKESEFFPGKISESGIGFTYQRILWRGLFTSVEILPLFKTYLDEDKKKTGNGFKLYTTYHLGYHVPLFRNTLYFEPQVHCNYWPVDTRGPQGFEMKENKRNNFFLNLGRFFKSLHVNCAKRFFR